MEKITFESGLARLGMRKAEFARRTGMRPGTVYRWTEANTPAWVLAYLGIALLLEGK